jgi:hypothetical protein
VEQIPRKETAMIDQGFGMSLDKQRRYLIQAIEYHESFIEHAYNRLLELDKIIENVNSK